MSDKNTTSVAAGGAIKAIGAYQALRHGAMSPCRFSPSCSAYAVEAIEHHGLLTGGRMAIWRIMRCNPFGGHGVDLVPLEIGESR